MPHPILIHVSDEVFEWLKKKGAEFSTDTSAANVANELVEDFVAGCLGIESLEMPHSDDIEYKP